MPEVQSTNVSGEMTQRFIEFIMMQAQQAAMFLGRMPNPQTGKPETNLEFARLFIDQLEMIKEKTRNNLTEEESEILTRVLSDLQMAFVQASNATPATEPVGASQDHQTVSAVKPPSTTASPPEDSNSSSESRKKFSKSYGS